MNPEHHRDFAFSVSVLKLLEAFSRHTDVEVETVEFIVTGNWVIGATTYKHGALLLSTSRTEFCCVESFRQFVARLAMSPTFFDCGVRNAPEICQTVLRIVLADELATKGG